VTRSGTRSGVSASEHAGRSAAAAAERAGGSVAAAAEVAGSAAGAPGAPGAPTAAAARNVAGAPTAAERPSGTHPGAEPPVVGIVGGSRSDFPILEKAAELLGQLGVPHELRVVSAHRTPDAMFRYAETAAERGLRVIIAGAGGAAHLPGMIASKTLLPVIGVPIPTPQLGGLDSLLSIVQMPRGIPVATVAIGNAENAALLAAQILALGDPVLGERLAAHRTSQRDAVLADPSNAPVGS